MNAQGNRYFSGLNYTIGNEDPTVEYEALPDDASHVVAVAGSGSRIIPLLAKHPERVTCIDASKEQLLFTELRLATLKTLPHDQWMGFWGYPGNTMSIRQRQTTVELLDLSAEARAYATQLFQRSHWAPLLYAGAWERAFKILSALNRIIVGRKGLDLFRCQSMEQQEQYLQTHFPHRAWSASIALLGNAVVFNALLYRGHFPRKNTPLSLREFYTAAFQRLFAQHVARTNFFLQLIFWGKLQFPEGLPLECRADIYANAQQTMETLPIQYIHGDIFTEIRQIPTPIDFVSLSDVPSYLDPPREQNFLQDIRLSLAHEAIVVNRYYLRTPRHLNTRGFIDMTNDFSHAIDDEQVQMYSFGIYKNNVL